MRKGKNSKYMCNDIQELRAAFNDIKSIVAGDTRFMAQALMFLCERAVVQKQPKEKRKPTAWQTFFAKGMREGKSPAQIAEEWRVRPQLKRVG
jgi:DNA-binding NarL/FixJ family response regulator